MDVPSGWIQVMRGPRPKAERWPNAKPPIQGGREKVQSQAPGRWRQERVRINPEVLRENAKRQVVGLEAAVAAMIANGIDEQSPEVAT